MEKMVTEEGPVLCGEKVLLRLFTPADINEVYIGWLNDPEVVRYSNQRFHRHDAESSRRYLATFSDTDNLFMSIHALSDNRQIGTMTAYRFRHHGTVDVGIMIGDRSVWGKGYGQDAWNTFTGWLLSQKEIRKLTAGTSALNYGMIKLMERSGMTFEAVRKAQEIFDGQAADILYYAKFRTS
ncbi:GNAT family N-acetyltransferase [Chlorobium ferrooxidans]|uniref:GCN5-related N-acetyltransferase n=1 Tax=Chlorobium ferrooxidans DSM 13031 TaxID=377431 RepID=Q0YTT5_9CHLB|nr:GNAT family N-acetyltransferase [Chlorobium ferrooxidans]EAT59816.1 GCN5-related N-acetyltransferase [Chlorobium ferrooxidans DSM 13031]